MQTVSPPRTAVQLPCSPLPPIHARCRKSFFPFFFFPFFFFHPNLSAASTPPPLAPMQAAPSLLPQPPPPQYLYDRRHLTDTVALQPASPDFVTQTGGAKGALGPTISATPPFTHPPRLCRSSHSRGCPHCAP